MLHLPFPCAQCAIETYAESFAALQTDPEAAKVVFESGVPLVMVPLEVGSRTQGILNCL